MQNLAKTLILNNEKDSNFKAILDIKKFNSSMIRFFNMSNPSRVLALGIKQNSKVIKVPLKVKDGVSVFDIKDNIDLDKTFLCAVIDISNPFCPEIILSGSQNSKNENENIESAFVQTKPQDTSVLYETQSQKTIDDLIDKNLEDDISSTYFDACAKCKYREAFYKEGGCFKSNIERENTTLNTQYQNISSEGQNSIENSEKGENLEDSFVEKFNDLSSKSADIPQTKYGYLDNNNEQTQDSKIMSASDNVSNLPIDQNEQVGRELTFYEQVKPQIDTLFAKYEEYTLLENIIPNSKWAKIEYDKDGNYYVLGILYNEVGEVLYICYGMPALSSGNPPDDLEEYAGFLPKDTNNPDGEGYFIVCQDATTGKTLKVDLI